MAKFKVVVDRDDEYNDVWVKVKAKDFGYDTVTQDLVFWDNTGDPVAVFNKEYWVRFTRLK